MTLASETTRKSYAGDDSTVEFPITFTILAKADLTVILRDSDGNEETETLDSDYEIDDDLTTVTWIKGDPVEPPATGETLLLIRDMDLKQEVDLVENDPFPTSTVEQAFDRLTMFCQILAEKLDRAFLLPKSNSQTGRQFYMGAGSPEGAVEAAVGSLYFNTSGGSETTLYVKESGSGDTGWVGK